MGSLPTRAPGTTKGRGIGWGGEWGHLSKDRTAVAAGGRRRGSADGTAAAAAGTRRAGGGSGTPPATLASPAACFRGGSGGGREPGALGRGLRSRAGPRGREDPAARAPLRRPRSPPLRLRAGRRAGPDAPRMPGGPGRRRGRRGRRAYLLRCGGAAVASRSRDLRQRRRRQSRRGGRFLQEGVGSARLPRRARPRLILGSPLPGLWGRLTPLPAPHPWASGVPHPSVPRVVTGGWSRVGTVEPLLSKAFVDAFAWRSSPNKRKDRVWDPPPGSSLFLTRCNLLAGSLLSTQLGFLHIAAKIHFRAHWLNAVVRH